MAFSSGNSGGPMADINVTENIGATILKAMRAIESANPDTLPGVFGDGDWGNKNLLPDSTLADLIEHFSTKTLSIANLPEDELGEARPQRDEVFDIPQCRQDAEDCSVRHHKHRRHQQGPSTKIGGNEVLGRSSIRCRQTKRGNQFH